MWTDLRLASCLPQSGGIHAGEKPCAWRCGEAFCQVDYLRQHQRTHTGGRPCECNSWGTSFGQREYLTWHLRNYTKEKPCVIAVRGSEAGRPLLSAKGSYRKLIQSGTLLCIWIYEGERTSGCCVMTKLSSIVLPLVCTEKKSQEY